MAQNGFIENSTTAYSYDANGNLSNDTDNGVIYTYNHLNLPYVATKGTDMVEWIYTAAGQKIRKTTTIDGAPISKDYYGSTESDPDGYVVYHAEGQVRQVNNALHWEYALRDHLGNTRILYEENNNSLDILQNNQYYAFGMSMYGEWSKQGMSENDYKYNGKELNSDMGLRVYEYGFRYYDPAIGRFTGVDPLADQFPAWNPYHYVHNNPLRYTDPTGMSADDIIDVDKGTGSITVTEAEGADVVRLVDNGNVVDSYTYGENGSFSSDNQIITGDFNGTQGTALVTANGDKAQTFFEFAAKSDVEFGKLDVTAANGNSVSVVTTSHDPKVTATLPSIAKELSSRGFTGVNQTHSHPDGQSVPSGHYGNVKGNPASLTPVPPSHPHYKRGDAQNARQTRSLSGFGNTKFGVYNPKTGGVTSYDGVNKAKIKN